MKNSQISKVNSVYSVNEYKVKRKKKKFSTLNLLLIQVGICLVVSATVLAIRIIGGSEIITSVSVNGYFDFINV